MAWMAPLFNITLKAGANLQGKKNLLLALDGAGNAVVASDAAKPIVGVLLNEPLSGKAATVCAFGVTKVKAGAAITAGSLVTTDANGAAVPWATGRYALGIALEGATAAGNIISVLINHGGL